MKKYYEVKYNDYGYGAIFNNYKLVYNGFRIEKDYSNLGYISLKKYKLFSNKIAKSKDIYIILEYDTNTKKYFDVITGEEYVEINEDGLYYYFVNKGGNLELTVYKYDKGISVNSVANGLKKLTPFEIEAYSIAMENLKKAADERMKIINEEKRSSQNYIETFKRNRKK